MYRYIHMPPKQLFDQTVRSDCLNSDSFRSFLRLLGSADALVWTQYVVAPKN